MVNVDLKPDKYINTVVSHHHEVQERLKHEAERVRDRAKAGLASHHKTGQHYIEMTHGLVDYTVRLVGPAAAALELGHVDHGKWVEGIHILRRQD